MRGEIVLVDDSAQVDEPLDALLARRCRERARAAALLFLELATRRERVHEVVGSDDPVERLRHRRAIGDVSVVARQRSHGVTAVRKLFGKAAADVT
jgi:hypothetical protein